MKILHVLYQSYPNISGSSTRSSDLIRAQKEIGLIPIVVTSPFQNGLSGENIEIIDGIKYYRTFSGRNSELVSESRSSIISKFVKLFQIFPFTISLYGIAKTENVDIIHAHAMFFCALPSKVVSILLGIKFIYEIRSTWEERSKSTLKRFLLRKVENFSAYLSKDFIVINNNLKNEFCGRGFNSSRIHVIDNSINLSRIEIPKAVSFVCKKKEDLVFGYIGSFSPIEGLGYIIEVFSILKQKGIKNKLLLFGAGIDYDRLESKIKALDLSDQVLLKGKFFPKDISSIYSQIDIIINPRIKSQITDTVTPLKPLEAFAFKKLFIGSNVGGIMELIGAKNVGLSFESDNLDSLERTVLYTLKLSNHDYLADMISRSHNFLLKEKSWSKNAYKYLELYKNI